jgi:hypothetical protein
VCSLASPQVNKSSQKRGRGKKTCLPALVQVRLVADQNLDRPPARPLVHIVHPCADGLERAALCHVEHHHDALRPPVVGAGHRSEALLPGRVPQLQLYHVTPDLHCPVREVHADRTDVLLGELVLSKADQQTGLPHTAVPDDDDLEQVVETLRASHCVLCGAQRRQMTAAGDVISSGRAAAAGAGGTQEQSAKLGFAGGKGGGRGGDGRRATVLGCSSQAGGRGAGWCRGGRGQQGVRAPHLVRRHVTVMM